MKQHITEEQWDELSEDKKNKLKSWWNPSFGDIYKTNQGYYLCESFYKRRIYRSCGYDFKSESSPLLSIGQMIEFLGDGWWRRLFSWDYGSINCEYESENKELCDALWEAVKDVL